MDEVRTAAEHVCATLTRAGHRALFAGGCVRDMLLGVPPEDYDIVTDAPPARIASLFDRTAPVGEQFGVTLVIVPEAIFEVATFRTEGAYHDGRHPESVDFVDEKRDALRRDFTINALFYDPASNEIVDYVGGQDDIRDGLVRTVGDPTARFAEDHLRLLRAVRFTARLNYTIHPDTYAAMVKSTPLIQHTSPERIRDEILKMLTGARPRAAFELLDATGLLEQVLPEVTRMKNVEQPAEFHPEGDVFAHTMLMLDEMVAIEVAPSPELAMAVLLHDVGKPLTITYDDRIRFNEHDRVGAELVRGICRRLNMPNDSANRIVWLVSQHMHLSHARNMRESKLKRFVRQAGFEDLLELCRIDSLASHRSLDEVQWVAEYAARLGPEEVRPAPLLTGSDLIAMGYAPGPLFGEILQAVEDAQLEHEIADVDGARAFVLSKWPRPTNED